MATVKLDDFVEALSQIKIEPDANLNQIVWTEVKIERNIHTTDHNK